MRTLIFLSVTIVLILAACTPDVTRTIYKNSQALQSNETVGLIDSSAAVPQSAEKLCSVNIDASSFTTQCSYEEVIEILREEAIKCGGNLIKIIEHKKPDLYSKCHRINADIYKVDPSELVSMDGRNLTNNKSKNAKLGQNLSLVSNDSNESLPLEIGPNSKNWYPQHRLAINAGVGYRTFSTSNIYDQSTKEYIDGLKTGFAFSCALQNFISKTLGFGIEFSMFNTSNSGRNSNNISMNDNINIDYLALSFISRDLLYDKTISLYFKGSAGYLYYMNNGSANNVSGSISGETWGLSGTFGIETVSNRTVGLGLELSYLYGNLTKVSTKMGGLSYESSLSDRNALDLGYFCLTLILTIMD